MSKVLIGLSTAEFIRKADFLPYFLSLHQPEGSLLTTIHGQSPAKARNIIIEQALANNCTHVFLMDDDMTPPVDTVTRLLAHDKDVVTGLYLMRSYPHFPVIFDQVFDNGFNKHLYLKDEVKGLIEITNCGLGCVLIKCEVFKKLQKPYVRLGEVVKDGWSDDIGFFNRVKEAGFKLYCDTEVRVGHMTTLTVNPIRINGQWFSEYKHNNGNVNISQVIPTEEDTKKQIEANQEQTQ